MSKTAYEKLHKQAQSLLNELQDIQYILSSEKRIGWYSDTGQYRIKKKEKLFIDLLEEHKMSLAKLSEDTSMTSNIWAIHQPGPYSDEKAVLSDKWVFSFYVYSVSKDVRISVIVNGKPIADTEGTIWNDQEIQLQNGKILPFEQKFNLHWKPIGELKDLPKAQIKVIDKFGNTTYLQKWGYKAFKLVEQ